VREVGLFRTILITGDGLYVSIPNSTIFSAPIVNNSREPLRQVNFKVTIDHSASIGTAQNLALSILHADQRVLKQPAPNAPVSEIGERGVTLAIQAWVPTATYGSASADLQKNIRERFRESGIQPPQTVLFDPALRTPEVAKRRSA
jgi:small conductance mechanosensitive channel